MLDGVHDDLGYLRRVSSFAGARILLTANNFRIFDHLEGRGRTVAALAGLIRADGRATELILNSLVAIGLLEKKGAAYCNSPVASKFLVKGKPDYQGDILRHYSVLWENWSGLDRVLKTGRPHRRSHEHTSFILGMHNIALQKVDEVMGTLDLGGVHSVLDLGGGPGTYAMAFARRDLNVTLFDFPDTFKISRKLIRDAGLRKRISLRSGNMLTDAWGDGYDLIFISQILHAYGPEDCLALLRKAAAALNPRGRVVVQEFHLEESRTAPLQGALFAINMLVNTEHGRTYTAREISGWMKKAGFSGIRNQVLEDTALVSARKKS